MSVTKSPVFKKIEKINKTVEKIDTQKNPFKKDIFFSPFDTIDKENSNIFFNQKKDKQNNIIVSSLELQNFHNNRLPLILKLPLVSIPKLKLNNLDQK